MVSICALLSRHRLPTKRSGSFSGWGGCQKRRAEEAIFSFSTCSDFLVWNSPQRAKSSPIVSRITPSSPLRAMHPTYQARTFLSLDLCEVLPGHPFPHRTESHASDLFSGMIAPPLFRSTRVLLGRWSPRDFMKGRSKRAGSIHIRHTHGRQGRYPRLSKHYGLRDGRRHANNRLGGGLGIKLGGGGGLFGVRGSKQHYLSHTTPHQYEIDVFGHPNITNPYRPFGVRRSHPQLKATMANAELRVELVVLLPRVSRQPPLPSPEAAATPTSPSDKCIPQSVPRAWREAMTWLFSHAICENEGGKERDGAPRTHRAGRGSRRHLRSSPNVRNDSPSAIWNLLQAVHWTTLDHHVTVRPTSVAPTNTVSDSPSEKRRTGMDRDLHRSRTPQQISSTGGAAVAGTSVEEDVTARHLEGLEALYREHCQGISLAKVKKHPSAPLPQEDPTDTNTSPKFSAHRGGNPYGSLSRETLLAGNASHVKPFLGAQQQRRRAALDTPFFSLAALRGGRGAKGLLAASAYASSSLENASSWTSRAFTSLEKGIDTTTSTSWKETERRVASVEREGDKKDQEMVLFSNQGAISVLEALRERYPTALCVCQRIQPHQWSSIPSQRCSNGYSTSEGKISATSTDSRRALPLLLEEDAMEDRIGPWAHLRRQAKDPQRTPKEEEKEEEEPAVSCPLSHLDSQDKETSSLSNGGETLHEGRRRSSLLFHPSSLRDRRRGGRPIEVWSGASKTLSSLVRWQYARADPRAHASDALPHDHRRSAVVLFMDLSKTTQQHTRAYPATRTAALFQTPQGLNKRSATSFSTTSRRGKRLEDLSLSCTHAPSSASFTSSTPVRGESKLSRVTPSLVSIYFAKRLESMGFLAIEGHDVVKPRKHQRKEKEEHQRGKGGVVQNDPPTSFSSISPVSVTAHSSPAVLLPHDDRLPPSEREYALLFTMLSTLQWNWGCDAQWENMPIP